MTPDRFGRATATVVFALALAACAATRTRESTGEYIDDSLLTTRVKRALINDPSVSGMAVNVETLEGIVQLSGFVKDAAERDRAVEVARQVKGVQQIKNDILIR